VLDPARWPFDHQKTRERQARSAYPDFGKAALHRSNSRPKPDWVKIAERQRRRQRLTTPETYDYVVPPEGDHTSA
jgi:hypothetical protein